MKLVLTSNEDNVLLSSAMMMGQQQQQQQNNDTSSHNHDPSSSSSEFFQVYREDDFTHFKIKLIACGSKHAILVTENNRVWVYGNNQYGQLGLSTVHWRQEEEEEQHEEGEDNSSQSLSSHVPLRKLSSNWNHLMPFEKQDIKLVACGPNSSAIVTSNNEIWMSGDNRDGGFGQLPHNVFVSFTRVASYLEGTIDQISIGNSHTFLVINNNELYSTGNNQRGQLALGHFNNRKKFHRVNRQGKILFTKSIAQVVCGAFHTVVLTGDMREVYVTGDNTYGQLGLGYSSSPLSLFHKCNLNLLPAERIKQISCGRHHTVAITDCPYVDHSTGELRNSPSIWVCGKNSNGAIALGPNVNNRGAFTRLVLPSDSNLKQICMSSPTDSTMILTEDNNIYATGDNCCMQLGLQGAHNRSTFEQVVYPSNNYRHGLVSHIAHGCYITALTIDDSCQRSTTRDSKMRRVKQFADVDIVVHNVKMKKKKRSCPSRKDNLNSTAWIQSMMNTSSTMHSSEATSTTTSTGKNTATSNRVIVGWC